MFHIFHEHNILPGQFYEMPTGEKLIPRAFVNEMLDRRAGKVKPNPNEKSKIKVKGRR